ACAGSFSRNVAHHVLPSFPTRRSSDLSIPELVTGSLGIGQRVKRKHDQVFPGLHLSGEVADDGRIFQIAALRDLRHCQVMLDERSEEHTSELQSPDHLVCGLLLENKNT